MCEEKETLIISDIVIPSEEEMRSIFGDTKKEEGIWLRLK